MAGIFWGKSKIFTLINVITITRASMPVVLTWTAGECFYANILSVDVFGHTGHYPLTMKLTLYTITATAPISQWNTCHVRVGRCKRLRGMQCKDVCLYISYYISETCCIPRHCMYVPHCLQMGNLSALQLYRKVMFVVTPLGQCLPLWFC